MIKHKFLLSMCITALLLFPFGRAVFSKTGQIEEARRLLNHGDFNQARTLLEDLPTDMQGIETWFLLGKLYYLTGEVDRAADLLEKASKSKPDSSQYSLWLARALGRKAEKVSRFVAPFLAKKARDAFRAAVDLDPNNLDARDDLLSYYLEAPSFLGGGNEKAVALVEQIKTEYPCHYWVQLALIYEKKKAFNQAEAALQKAGTLNPACMGGLSALAEFYQRRGQISNAREALQKTVQLFPREPSAHFHLGRFEVEAGGNLERGRAELKAFLKYYVSDNPYPYEAYYWLGEICLKLNQPVEAVDDFKLALQFFSAHAPSLKGLEEAKQQMSYSRE